MRYNFELTGKRFHIQGDTYHCDHPLYDVCTLYKEGAKGLAVIQEYYLPSSKKHMWSKVDSMLVDELYYSDNFKTVFERYAAEPKDGLYPTLTLRQIMWALRMKPLPKEHWETAFDRKPL